MQPFKDALDQRVLVCDGAMGTMLYSKGVFINKSFDALNLTRPELADRLILAIGLHPGKAPLFSAEERLAMLAESCGPVAKAAGCELKTVTFAS